MTESLLLKWGTLIGWELKSDKSKAILKAWAALGMTYGAMDQRDTDEQKKLICDLIDAVDGEIQNDWTDDMMSKDEAKEYVMNYRR